MNKSVLFAGTSIAYLRDERLLVERLNSVCQQYAFELVYRPHPRRLISDRSWAARLSNVRIDDALGYEGGLEHFGEIMTHTQGIVSAFSTLVLEAALFGKPSLIVAFGASSGGSEYDAFPKTGLLDHAKYSHMQEVLSWPGIVTCRSFEDLEQALQAVLRGNYAVYADELKQRAQTVVRCDGHARERICEAIERTAYHA